MKNKELPKIFSKRTIISVDCSDLTGFIHDKYGIHVEIEASFEIGHDETIEIEANAGEADEADFNKILNEGLDHNRDEIETIMHQLAKDGHIENGNYLIETC